MSEKDTKQISVEIDLKSKRIIGSSNSSNNDHVASLDLEKRIVKSISRAFGSISDKWIEEYCEQLQNKNFEGAYQLFDKNRGLLQFSNDKSVLEKLRLMDVSKLNRNDRKEFLIFLIAFSGHFGERDKIDIEIEQLLNEYEEELEPKLLQNLMLEKANIAAISGLYNKAFVLYNKIISSDENDAGPIAWAYQGLSLISSNNDDLISYAEKAADKHLESGNKIEAIKNIIKIFNLKAPREPNESIRLLDYSMSLYEGERLIDRELLASLKHKKSSYLYEIGKHEEALPLAEEC